MELTMSNANITRKGILSSGVLTSGPAHRLALACSQSKDFLQFGFDSLLSLPSHRTKAGMELRLVRRENEIALTNCRAIKSIRAGSSKSATGEGSSFRPLPELAHG